MNKVYLQQMLRDCDQMAAQGGESVLWAEVEKQCVTLAQMLTIADLYKRLARNATSAEYALYCWQHHDKWEIDALHTAAGNPQVCAALGHNAIPIPPQYR